MTMKDIEYSNRYSDDEDEWYHNSIVRYNELDMFDMEHPIQRIDLSDPTSMCILSQKSSDQQVISQHSLPYKILRRKIPQNRIVKDTDMKVKSGIFPETTVYQMCALYGQDRLITSEENISGFNIYQLNDSGTDRIVKLQNINVPISSPNLALFNKTSVFVCKDSYQISRVIDVSTGETKCCINNQNNNKERSNLSPLVVSETIIGMCNETSGEIHFYDIRNGQQSGQLEGAVESGTFKTCSSYNYTDPNNNQHLIGIFSEKGTCKIYDKRNLSQEVIIDKVERNLNKDFMKASFSPDGNHVSFSGIVGGFVIVCELGNNGLKEIFCHDGHIHMEYCSKKTMVTDHLWYDDKCVISSADNNSLNCWEFNPKI